MSTNQQSKMEDCVHAQLTFESALTGSGAKLFRCPSTPERITASRGSESKRRAGKRAKTSNDTVHVQHAIALPEESTYPGPLVLPGDDLFFDPEYPPQSVQEWIDESDRNPVTNKRKTVYVVPAPLTPPEMRFISEWANAITEDDTSNIASERQCQPNSKDVLEYLQAFYHPLPVKLLQTPQPQWVEWDEVSKRNKTNAPRYIGLDIGGEAVRITTRKSPDGAFARQLNLNDLIDATMAFLPSDAYALLMLLEHDIYEDEDDDFCCGRAYGNSRVAVISMARYNPVLDTSQNVERVHAWPASHCRTYVESQLRRTKPKEKKMRSKAALEQSRTDDPHTAMRHAVSAARAIVRGDPGSLWLGRVCKTASHEVGHCFALDHCVFFACAMQGTAGMSEDARQPPYLCPVDLAKLLAATGAEESQRDRELLRVCQKYEDSDGMWAGFAAWLRFRLGG